MCVCVCVCLEGNKYSQHEKNERKERAGTVHEGRRRGEQRLLLVTLDVISKMPVLPKGWRRGGGSDGACVEHA